MKNVMCVLCLLVLWGCAGGEKRDPLLGKWAAVTREILDQSGNVATYDGTVLLFSEDGTFENDYVRVEQDPCAYRNSSNDCTAAAARDFLVFATNGRYSVSDKKIDMVYTSSSCANIPKPDTFGYDLINGDTLRLVTASGTLTFRRVDEAKVLVTGAPLTYGCFSSPNHVLFTPMAVHR